MSKLICSSCMETFNYNQLSEEHKQNSTCPECKSKLKYIGNCGECLNFDEFYNERGICDVSSEKVHRNKQGCLNFK